MSSCLRARLLTVLFVVGVAPSLGCGNIELPISLALEQPSELTLELPIFPPPNDVATTFLVGGAEATIVADLGLLKLLGALVGKALPADIAIDDVLIAGSEIVIGGALPTGTICVFQDPDLASSGEAQFNLLLGMAAFEMQLNTLLALTDPTLGGLLGGPAPFGQAVSAVVPLSIADLLGILAGGGGGLALTQEIDTEFGPVPILGTVHVTGALTLASADGPPSDPMLDECEAFIAGL